MKVIIKYWFLLPVILCLKKEPRVNNQSAHDLLILFDTRITNKNQQKYEVLYEYIKAAICHGCAAVQAADQRWVFLSKREAITVIRSSDATVIS